MLDEGLILDILTPEVFEPFLEPARYKGAHGGRGSGKSHFFAELLIELAILWPSLHGSGLRAVCIREVQKSLEQSVKRLLEDKIAKLGVGHLFEIMQAEIRCPMGGLIIFQGMQNHTADSIKSLEGYDIAWVEEAQTMSQHSLDLLRPTIRKDYADGTTSEIWFSWNPRFSDDPVDKFLRQEAPTNSIIREVNWLHNPFFPKVLREDLEYDKRRDPDRYAHVWMGQYQKSSEARVFRNWTIADGFLQPPPQTIFYFGADWGYSTDPSVLIKCWIEGRTLYIGAEAHEYHVEIDHTPDLWDKVPGSRKWKITADSSDPQNISYMRRKGFNVVPSIKGPNSVEQGVEFLKSYDIVVDPRCVHTIDELTFYSYKIDPRTEKITSVLEDKKNHVIDSIRYAIEDVRNAVPMASVGTFGRR